MKLYWLHYRKALAVKLKNSFSYSRNTMKNGVPIINQNIIVVEPDAANRANTVALLSQQGWNVRDTDNSYEAIQWIKKDNQPHLLIIADNATPLNAAQAIDYIRREIHSEIPVLIAHGDTNDIQNYGKKTECFVKPFDMGNIDTIRKIIGSTQEAEHVYSLNYLNTLSSGDNDFIIDCLGVFITSVTAKLSQLSEALQQKDYKTIGEIAHNIKPSFEMLESSLSADICNKLTYSATEEEFPELASELSEEFNKIANKLKTDFPELRSL